QQNSSKLAINFVYNDAMLRILWKALSYGILRILARACTALPAAAMHLTAPRLETVRAQAGISPIAWELLLVDHEPDNPDKARKKSGAEFINLLERGASLPAADWKLLTQHPVHEFALRGVVFATEGRHYFVPPDWPQNLKTLLSIAHPAMMSPEQRETWK